jgi:hypothetical protein
MSHEPTDDVARALALLARRADAAPAAGRLVAVHRKARRAAQRRTAGVVAALVLAVGGAGLALDRGTGADRGSGPAVSPTSPGVDVSLEPETDPVVLAAANGRGVEGPGTRVVVLRLRVTGQVPGGVVGLRLEQPGLGSSGTGDIDCPPGRALVPVNLDELETLAYPADSPATARVVVTVTACDPVGAVTREVDVQVPLAPAPTG